MYVDDMKIIKIIEEHFKVLDYKHLFRHTY